MNMKRSADSAAARALLIYVILGLLFGIVLTKSEVISWFRIQEMFRFQSFHMYGIIGSAIVVIDDDYRPRGIRRSPTSHEDICASPWAGFYMPHPTWLARTEKLVAFGYRDFSLCEDQELLLRAHRWLRLGNTEEVLLGYREGAPSWRKMEPRRH